MINIRNLQDYSEQEIFDFIARHLLTQKQKAILDIDSQLCAYRGQNNTRCAAGILIPDDLYQEEMENKSWDVVRKRLGYEEHCELIILKAQWIHDFTEVEDWESQLKSVAEKYGLNWNF